ncbi:hypothetical protein [Acetobacter orleanensis]|uniref:Uncharacterized protein n=1 Tax=Acetobacter orleanensis TaxID=104099 RepID=A0A4Y3TMI8_9PROT|nr:hypothetical protein [Acetobacter orleanensis]PCD79726.1 hypothetical protein CO710_05860 [Acetobacter orleanensis]GAN69294.1 hypothetical protein Abol_030_059 [Acetobacter orleanensis JCM 7639]GBR28311.1 hypothetical protein AA0473_1708 [Acetobacter orleanensis NRIC 0473]GEB82180.1 hypothetical protein AOR01nite_06570 [Acetobacter orleanensis]
MPLSSPPPAISPRNPGVKAGFFKTATEADGTPVAAIAAVQEFGAVVRGRGGHSVIIPPHPFLRQTVAQRRSAWVRQLAEALKATLRAGGAGTTEPPLNTLVQRLSAPTQALTTVGKTMQADITQTIRQTHTPSNAPATIRHKGFDKPLLETGTLQNGVSFQVEG